MVTTFVPVHGLKLEIRNWGDETSLRVVVYKPAEEKFYLSQT
jgi:hypothetical protein